MGAENLLNATRKGKSNKSTYKLPGYVNARILWPALGFPEVVEPQKAFSLLLLCERDDLKENKNIVSKYLRFVSWKYRTMRYCPGFGGTRYFDICQGGFSSDEIEINKLVLDDEDNYVKKLAFANLSKFVVDFYSENGLGNLYEIIIQTEANHLPTGHYNLFWQNDSSHTPKISSELKFLKDKFAIGRVADEAWYKGKMIGPKDGEYVSEYGTPAWKEPFVEVLHPLFM